MGKQQFSAVGLGVVLAISGCGAPAPTPGPGGGAGCYAGQVSPCTCLDGRVGSSVCGNFGTYGACTGCGGGTCTPACSGRNCGDDGCGGSCGTCNGGLSCLSGSCGVDPASQWSIRVLGGTISQRGPDGSTWDAFGGAPDPYVCVTIGGARTCTPAIPDSFTPVWNQDLPPATANTLRAGISVATYEEDVASNDTICGLGTFPITLEMFERGTFIAQCDYGSVSFGLNRVSF